MSLDVDVVVVGSGPAGLAAAEATASHGLATLIVDEYPTPGGRLLGQLHEEPEGPKGRWWRGAEEAANLVTAATEAGATIECGCDVWGVFPTTGPRRFLACLGRGRADTVATDYVVVATGAGEQGVPLPGWQLPGVLTVGGAQVMANVHRVRPGRRALVVGIDPLALAIARELDLAGVDVLGLVQPGPVEGLGRRPDPRSIVKTLLSLGHLAPNPWLRLASRAFRGEPWPRLVTRLYPRRGMRAWGIPVRARSACLSIEGDDEVRAAIVAELSSDGRVVPGSEHEVEVDCVAVSGGLYPLLELAVTLGCEVAFVPELGGHVPVHGPDYETTVEGVFVAGSVTGVEGASVAAAQGRAAGLGVVLRGGTTDEDSTGSALRRATEEVARVRDDAPFRFHEAVDAGRERVASIWESRHA